MARQYFVTPISPFHIASAAAYASSTTLTDVSPLPHITLNGNQLELGTRFRIRASGQFSNTATPTLLLGFYYGGVAGVALAASAATTTTTGATAWPWIMLYQGTVRAVGSTGSIVGQGNIHLGTSLVALADIAFPATAAARTVAVDTTVAKLITVGAQWGTNSASNTLTCDELSVEFLN